MQARCVVVPTALPRSCGAGRALLCLGRHLGWEESASSVVPMPSGAVVVQWQVPAVEAIFRTTMVLLYSMLFRAYESPEGRGDGKGGMGQPV